MPEYLHISNGFSACTCFLNYIFMLMYYKALELRTINYCQNVFVILWWTKWKKWLSCSSYFLNSIFNLMYYNALELRYINCLFKLWFHYFRLLLLYLVEISLFLPSSLLLKPSFFIGRKEGVHKVVVIFIWYVIFSLINAVVNLLLK